MKPAITSGLWVITLVVGVAIAACSPRRSVPPTATQPEPTRPGPTRPDPQTPAVPEPAPAPVPEATPSAPPTAQTPTSPPPPPRPTPTPGVPPSGAEIEQTLQAQNLRVARQSPATGYLHLILESQKAQHLVSGSFQSSLEALYLDAFADSEDYQVAIVAASADQAIITATPTQAGYPSYVGAVYALDASIPLAGICRSNLPSQNPPPAPRMIYGQIQCAPGSTPLED